MAISWFQQEIEWSRLTVFCSNLECRECPRAPQANTRQFAMNYIGGVLGDHWYECPACSSRTCLEKSDEFSGVGFREQTKPIGKWFFPILTVSVIGGLMAVASLLWGFALAASATCTHLIFQLIRGVRMTPEEWSAEMGKWPQFRAKVVDEAAQLGEYGIECAAIVLALVVIIRACSKRFPAVRWLGNKNESVH